MPRLTASLVLGFAVLAAHPAYAQVARSVPPLPQWEARVEGTAAREPAVHAGIGINVRAGYYARVGLTGAAGAARGADDVWRGSQRVDAAVRFLLDPFTEQPRGLYGGAGVSLRHDAGDLTPALLLLAGVEGRPRGGVSPALEVAVGGGVRFGVVLRRTRSGRAR
jgi:hypothetical protein